MQESLAPSLEIRPIDARVGIAHAHTSMAQTASTLKNAANHQSVKLAKDINWLKIWEAARDRGQFWTGIVQNFSIQATHYTCLRGQDMLEM